MRGHPLAVAAVCKISGSRSKKQIPDNVLSYFYEEKNTIISTVYTKSDNNKRKLKADGKQSPCANGKI